MKPVLNIDDLEAQEPYFEKPRNGNLLASKRLWMLMELVPTSSLHQLLSPPATSHERQKTDDVLPDHHRNNRNGGFSDEKWWIFPQLC